MAGMINPIYQRAPGVIPQLPISSESERVLGRLRNDFRDIRDTYKPNCYRIRYECVKCGQYEFLVASVPEPIPTNCHHCGSERVSIDGCWGWTAKTLPHVGTPIAIRTTSDYERKTYTLTCAWCVKQFVVATAARNKQKCCSVQCTAERQKYLRATK